MVESLVHLRRNIASSSLHGGNQPRVNSYFAELLSELVKISGEDTEIAKAILSYDVLDQLEEILKAETDDYYTEACAVCALVVSLWICFKDCGKKLSAMKELRQPLERRPFFELILTGLRRVYKSGIGANVQSVISSLPYLFCVGGGREQFVAKSPRWQKEATELLSTLTKHKWSSSPPTVSEGGRTFEDTIRSSCNMMFEMMRIQPKHTIPDSRVSNFPDITVLYCESNVSARMQEVRRCSNCLQLEKVQESGKLRKCGRCKMALYCSKECQASHWVGGGHRTNCTEEPFRKKRAAARAKRKKVDGKWTTHTTWRRFLNRISFAISQRPWGNFTAYILFFILQTDKISRTLNSCEFTCLSWPLIEI